jgi:hypothetical protein
VVLRWSRSGVGDDGVAVLEVLLFAACCTTAGVDEIGCSKGVSVSCGAGTKLVLLLVEVQVALRFGIG